MSIAHRRPSDQHRASTALLLAAALIVSAGALAQDRGSPSDQEACTPDVFRLCNDLIPDETQIVACLQSKRAQLSPACGKIFGLSPERARKRPERAG